MAMTNTRIKEVSFCEVEIGQEFEDARGHDGISHEPWIKLDNTSYKVKGTIDELCDSDGLEYFDEGVEAICAPA